jgi:hypothetical protein
MSPVARVSVVKQTDGTYGVEVRDETDTTSHVVGVPAGLPAALGCDHVAPEELVRASFGFLLEREPATSILRRFSLDQISRYFPEYPGEVHRRLSRRT